jgi:hypothetical protein
MDFTVPFNTIKHSISKFTDEVTLIFMNKAKAKLGLITAVINDSQMIKKVSKKSTQR